MSGLLCVLPIVKRSTTDKCIDSIIQPNSACGIDPKDILLVDNTREGWVATDRRVKGFRFQTYRDPDGHNLGVARSWNIGARRVLDEDLDYLVIMSASMLFGPELHTTWLRQMETFWGESVIECEGNSWHLIALHRRLFEQVGLFDEAYYPAYMEQTDWCYRLRMKRLEHSFTHVWVNALSQGAGLHVNDGKGQTDDVDCPAGPLLAHYRDKFGGDKGEETYVQPWGNKPIDYWPEYSIPELAEKYGLVNWW